MQTNPLPVGWIPVQQALPEADHLVLASDGVGVFLASCASEVPEMDWVIVFGPVLARGVTITHWLPLPMPPDTPMH